MSFEGEAEQRMPRDTETFAWDVLAASSLTLSEVPVPLAVKRSCDLFAGAVLNEAFDRGGGWWS
jgi:hypothetical protein